MTDTVWFWVALCVLNAVAAGLAAGVAGTVWAGVAFWVLAAWLGVQVGRRLA